MAKLLTDATLESECRGDHSALLVYEPHTADTWWEVSIGEYCDYPDCMSFLKSRLRANKNDLNKLADEMDMTPDSLLDNLLDGADGMQDVIEDMVVECYHGKYGDEV